MTFVAVSPGARPRRFLSSRTMISSNAAGRDRAVLALVLVAAVARDAEHPDRPSGPRRGPGRADPAGLVHAGSTHHPIDEVGQLAHAVDVVAVVDDHPDATDVEQVEPARRLEERRREGAQALADVVQVGAG